MTVFATSPSKQAVDLSYRATRPVSILGLYGCRRQRGRRAGAGVRLVPARAFLGVLAGANFLVTDSTGQ